MAKERGGRRFLNRKDMHCWLSEEIRNVLKECDLRIRDATDFAVGYANGELTAEQAHERLRLYEERWPDPLGGVFASGHSSDKTILDAIDRWNVERRSLISGEIAGQIAEHRPSPGGRRGPSR